MNAAGSSALRISLGWFAIMAALHFRPSNAVGSTSQKADAGGFLPPGSMLPVVSTLADPQQGSRSDGTEAQRGESHPSHSMAIAPDFLHQQALAQSSANLTIKSHDAAQAAAQPITTVNRALVPVREHALELLNGAHIKNPMVLASSLNQGRFLHQSDQELAPDSSDIVATRTRMFSAFKDVYQKLQGAKVPVFPRNGMLLGVVRDHGFLRWDYDTDMTLLDKDFEKLLAAKQQVSFSPYTLEIDTSNGDWRVTGAGLPWPVMDGVRWSTATGNVVSHDAGIPWMADQNAGLKGFPIEDWEHFEAIDFYCLHVKIPRGYSAYLNAAYGTEWRNAAKNKCSKSGGDLYKVDPGHCSMACYMGAEDLPHEMPVGEQFRGQISSTACSNDKAFQELP